MKKWDDIKHKGWTPERIQEQERAVAVGLLDIMELRGLREALGITQGDLARMANISQPEVSRLERRPDIKLSTLRKVIAALGGELELIVNIGDKRVEIRPAGVAETDAEKAPATTQKGQ